MHVVAVLKILCGSVVDFDLEDSLREGSLLRQECRYEVVPLLDARIVLWVVVCKERPVWGVRTWTWARAETGRKAAGKARRTHNGCRAGRCRPGPDRVRSSSAARQSDRSLSTA
jgi:hypothetical protein